MKLSTSLLLLVCVAPFAVAGVAEPDYDGIRKDINIMNKIIQVAVENGDACDKCRASIRGSYLARQGALFVVSPQRTSFREIAGPDGNWALAAADSLDDLQSLEYLEGLPEMIGDIVTDVGITLGGLNIESDEFDDHEVHITQHKVIQDESRDIQRQLRSFQRQMRRLSENISDKEVEMMGADEAAHAQLEAQLKEMESELAKLEQQQSALSQQLSEARQERQQQREKIRAEAAQNRLARNARIETIVIGALCDYGATLKNLPADEMVTVLFENDGSKWGENQTRVYVINKKDLGACQKGEVVRDALVKRAIVYSF